MIYETLFIVSLSRITFDSNHPTLDKCCLSLLNGMIFDIVRKNNRLIPYDGDI